MNNEKKEYQKAIDYLCNLIENGELTVGSKLPTERSLAQTLSIGRNSTREALRSLEIMGIIESRRGSGNFLVGNISKNISSAIDMMLLLRQTNKNEVCSFRRNMDKSVCMSIIESGKFQGWKNKFDEILANEESETDVEKQAQIDKDFHYTLILATENQLYVSISEAVMAVYRRWIEKILINADDNIKKQLHKTHRDIVLALDSSDRIACEKAIDLHYKIVERELRI